MKVKELEFKARILGPELVLSSTMLYYSPEVGYKVRELDKMKYVNIKCGDCHREIRRNFSYGSLLFFFFS